MMYHIVIIKKEYVMVKNRIYPSYWMLLLCGILGTQLYHIIIILDNLRYSGKFIVNYSAWLKNEGIQMEIIYVIFISIIYIIKWLVTKLYA